jgi:hypothetical protein
MSDEIMPDWLESIMEAIGLTDGVGDSAWYKNDQGDYVVRLDYGEEEISFVVDTDGESHGADCDGNIFDMTDPSDVQFWCAAALYMRLQKAKKEIEDLRQWRLMESAPKDGSKVLVWTHHGRVETARWDDDRFNKFPSPLWKIDGPWGRRQMREHPPLAWKPLPEGPS